MGRTTHAGLFRDAKEYKTLYAILFLKGSEAERKRLRDLGVLTTECFGGED